MQDDIRHGRYWLLSAQLAAILPQWERLPVWLSMLVVAACVWRLPRVEIRLPPPSYVPRVVLFLGMFGLWRSYHSLVGPEAGTAFLILCMSAKLLEMRSWRDCHVVIILGFFVTATNFLFDQSLVIGLYALLVVVLIVGSLLAIHQPRSHSGKRTARQALSLTAQAFPLMIILFVFFPRLPPLWTMHVNKGNSITGVSDSLSPGDIAHLSQSDALAFHVEFQGQPPAKEALYWRGLVLGHFDGDTWSREPDTDAPSNIAWPNRGPVPNWLYGLHIDRNQTVKYRVTLEPTGQTWLFGLNVPYSTDEDIGLTREVTLQTQNPVTTTLRYEVTTYRPLQLDVTLPDAQRQDYLDLPKGNPRTRSIAQQWRLQYSDDSQYINHVLDWYRQQGFSYTLSPPTLTGDRVDQFLFETRAGFCEHYASSFVVLMRAAGIPARMVVGYQGGQPGPRGDYWEVRQMDAHAWAEVWLPAKGWTSYDPTAAVSPNRIRLGASSLMHQPAYWGGGNLGYSNFRLFEGLRRWADDLNFRWNRDIMGYTADRQDSFLTKLLGKGDYLMRTLVMAGCFAAVLAVMVLVWWRMQVRIKEPPADRYYRAYCRRMAAAGLPRKPGEGPADYADRVARERPALAGTARQVRQLYAHVRYAPPGKDQDRLLAELRRLAYTTRVKA